MMLQVSLDLETFGTGSNAVIVAIGAKTFDSAMDHFDGKEFYARVDAQTCVNAGMEMNVATINWWLNQSESARAELLAQPRLQIVTALGQFASWYPKDAPLWGNGATFDNVILKNAYDKCHFTAPWTFYNDRDLRTLKSLRPDLKIEFEGTQHNALDDAIHQARLAYTILKQLEI